MIVRNEEECLLTALESTVGLADEVVVVDTGSTDATLDIAREFGCRVYTGADRMHKAQSRNLAMDKALCDWIVILDADERIADPVGLRAYIQRTKEQKLALALYTRLTYIDESGQETAALSQLRCWKRGMLRYKYRCHELPVPANDQPKLAQVTGFMWEHRPPRKREGWKLQYSLDRILLDVEENPGDSRPVYYLGRQYMYMKQYKKAVEWLRKHIAMGGGPDIADVWYSLSRCYQRIEGYEKEQIMAMHQACAINPLRREYWGELANEYWKRGFHRVAIGLMKTALDLPPMDVGVSQLAWFSDIPEKVLAEWERRADGIRDRAGIQAAAGPGRPAAGRPAQAGP
jgi:glycosyltransferase involved in cell wall biosynthesis